MLQRNPPKSPTEEQKAVLESRARITVVRACPGAGKTEVFVEAIRQKLADWDSSHCGLAALSFTNIARDTIEMRVGGVVHAPHYVGTLDAFIFRFIVRPFGHLIGLPKGAVRLIPAVVSDNLQEPTIQVGSKSYERATLFSVHFSGINDDSLVITANVQNQRNFLVPKAITQKVLSEKIKFWKRTGMVTHSDCHLIAAWILNDKTHGVMVSELLTHRFPAVFIDELQDTGCFLGEVFLRLFQNERISGLVVGDPNQAIYGFGGASGSIFDDFEKLTGAKALQLTLSQRCPKIIAGIVSQLGSSGTTVQPLSTAGNGRATLLVHELNDAYLSPPQATKIRQLHTGVDLAVISRKSATARMLKGDSVRDDFQGKSKVARRINLAVRRLLNGEPREAFQIVERELYRIVLDDERAKYQDLEIKGISREQWREAIYQVLTLALQVVQGESWNQWVERIKALIGHIAISLGCQNVSNSLRSFMQCNATGGVLRQPLLDVNTIPLWHPNDTITTVHKVKGAEFDTVVLFVPKPHRSHAPCPSTEWWPNELDSEERRIAFVAASRAKQHFVLCIHKVTYETMLSSRKEFVAAFGEPIWFSKM